GKQRVEAAHRHGARLLYRPDLVATLSMRVHRAHGRMSRVEIEDALFVGGSRRNRMVVAIGPAPVAATEVADSLLDRIEAVDDQLIAELPPSWMLAPLHSHIHEHKRLFEMALLHYPLGKCGVEII